MGMYFSDKEERYEKIISLLCRYKGIDREELINILKDRECKHLFFLLIKKYECNEMKLLQKDFPLMSKNSISNNFKRAEQKLFLNRKIRDMYFEAEEFIERVK
jgi:hypothetical protein